MEGGPKAELEDGLQEGSNSDEAGMMTPCFPFQIYAGYVDDPRNTDNSWMETVAVNFHDTTGELVGKDWLQLG